MVARQELTDRVVAMVIESTPEIASDPTVKKSIASLRIVQAALQVIADGQGEGIKIRSQLAEVNDQEGKDR